MKKILSIGLFCILLVTIFSSHALAETVEFKEDSEIVPVVENMGVSDVLPFTTELNDSGAVTPYTAETPSQTWNLANKGQYNFSGTA